MRLDTSFANNAAWLYPRSRMRLVCDGTGTMQSTSPLVITGCNDMGRAMIGAMAFNDLNFNAKTALRAAPW